MSRTITVFSDQSRIETKWVSEILDLLKSPVFADFGEASKELSISVHGSEEQCPLGEIVLLDARMKKLKATLEALDRKGRAVLLVVHDTSEKDHIENHWHSLLKEDQIDDVIGYPFRPVELLSKFRYYKQLVQWNQVFELSTSFSELLKRFEEDLLLAERIQSAKYPKKFFHIKGFKVLSRYLAGMASGGDYFDVAESRDQTHLSVILSNSSNYGLSSAVLTILMRVMLKLSADHLEELGTPSKIVRQIYDEILMTLGLQDHLSICYGIVSRYSQTFRYLNLGTGAIFHAYPNEKFTELPKHALPISKGLSFTPEIAGQLEKKLDLVSGSRLVLVSRGIVEAVGDCAGVEAILNAQESAEALKTLNDFIFLVKSKLGADEMPKRDCSAILLEVESPAIKIVKKV